MLARRPDSLAALLEHLPTELGRLTSEFVLSSAPSPEPPTAGDDAEISESRRCPPGQKGCTYYYELPAMAAAWWLEGGVARRVVQLLYDQLGEQRCTYAACAALPDLEDYTTCYHNGTFYSPSGEDDGRAFVFHRCCCRENPGGGGGLDFPGPWEGPPDILQPDDDDDFFDE